MAIKVVCPTYIRDSGGRKDRRGCILLLGFQFWIHTWLIVWQWTSRLTASCWDGNPSKQDLSLCSSVTSVYYTKTKTCVLEPMRYRKSNWGDGGLLYHSWQTSCSLPFHEVQDKVCFWEGIGTRVTHGLDLDGTSGLAGLRAQGAPIRPLCWQMSLDCRDTTWVIKTMIFRLFCFCNLKVILVKKY